MKRLLGMLQPSLSLLGGIHDPYVHRAGTHRLNKAGTGQGQRAGRLGRAWLKDQCPWISSSKRLAIVRETGQAIPQAEVERLTLYERSLLRDRLASGLRGVLAGQQGWPGRRSPSAGAG